jgi:hypothetical protein
MTEQDYHDLNFKSGMIQTWNKVLSLWLTCEQEAHRALVLFHHRFNNLM